MRFYMNGARTENMFSRSLYFHAATAHLQLATIKMLATLHFGRGIAALITAALFAVVMYFFE